MLILLCEFSKVCTLVSFHYQEPKPAETSPVNYAGLCARYTVTSWHHPWQERCQFPPHTDVTRSAAGIGDTPLPSKMCHVRRTCYLRDTREWGWPTPEDKVRARLRKTGIVAHTCVSHERRMYASRGDSVSRDRAGSGTGYTSEF